MRRWLLALFVTAILVAICWMYVDRPVADFVTLHFMHTRVMGVAHVLLMPLPATAIVALGFLLVHTLRQAAGEPAARWTQTPAVAAWAVAWALGVTAVLKRLVGRTDVYPSWVLNRVYTVHPVFWRPNSDAFPSGTMLIGTALMAVLWLRWPGGRPAWMAFVLVLVALLVVTNSHWISDIIAGTFLGGTLGWLTSATMPGEDPEGAA